VKAAWEAIRSWRSFITDLAKVKQQREYDIKGKPAKQRKLTFEVGDTVMINRNRAKVGQSRKFVLPWRGPFHVLRKTDRRGEYILAVAAADDQEYPEKKGGELRWNAKNMKKYVPNSLRQQDQKGFAMVEELPTTPNHPSSIISTSGAQEDEASISCHHLSLKTSASGARDAAQAAPVPTRVSPGSAAATNQVHKRLTATDITVGDLLAYYAAPPHGLVRGRVLKRSKGKKPTITVLFEDRSVEIKPLQPYKFVASEDGLLSAGQWCSAEMPLTESSLVGALGHEGTEVCRSIESNLKAVPHYRIIMPNGQSRYFPVHLAEGKPWNKKRAKS